MLKRSAVLPLKKGQKERKMPIIQSIFLSQSTPSTLISQSFVYEDDDNDFKCLLEYLLSDFRL